MTLVGAQKKKSASFAYLGEHGVDDLLDVDLLLHEIFPVPLAVHVDRLLLHLRHLSEDGDAFIVRDRVPGSHLSRRGGRNVKRQSLL